MGRPKRYQNDRQTGSKDQLSATDYRWHVGAAITLSIFAGLICQFVRYRTSHIDEPVGSFENSVLQTPHHYAAQQLHAYTNPPVVPSNAGQPGDFGQAVHFPAELQNLVQSRFKEHEFNIMASDAIAYNRSLPDIRSTNCKAVTYPDRLPNTTVIIVFHNEAWSTLIRTVWSIINRSPRPLLHEILLVDDASDHPQLGDDLDAYVAQLPVPTRVLRQRTRYGLIQARLMGAAVATGATMTFLDAHCECTDGWLPPLLARVAANRRTVPSPTIDIISDDTFELKTIMQSTYGGFSSKFVFSWVDVPPREWQRIGADRTQPLRQPTMAGGLFTIDRAFFHEIGAYDEGMRIWGGENMELSLRLWMCGGALELDLCSHVGHVYRKKTPYTFPKGSTETIAYNAVRMARVWLDDYQDVFDQVNAVSQDLQNDHGDLSARHTLRQRLQCKSFEWYLNHIYPEAERPEAVLYAGEIRSAANSAYCLDAWQTLDVLRLAGCHGAGGNQRLSYTASKLMTVQGYCYQADGDSAAPDAQPVRAVACNADLMHPDTDRIVYDAESQSIRSVVSNRCLTANPADGVSVPLLQRCDESSAQRWLVTADSTE